MLLIVCGLPGTGKTTLSAALAEKFSAVHISSDIIRRRMFPKPAYSEAEKEAVYAEMARQASEALASGRNVIADATFYVASERRRFLSLAKAGEGRIILCKINDDAARERLGSRPKGASDADFGVYMKLKEMFEAVREEHLEIDAALPNPEKVRIALGYLGR